MKKKFACDTCGGVLGFVDLDRVTVPIKADHFTSLMPERKVPNPFHAGNPWIECICPRCKHRAFRYPDKITLIDDRGKKQIISVDKIRAEEKAREANQAKIDAMFKEEPESKIQGFVNKIIGKKPFTCPKCGREYQHQTSLIRHQKDCK